MTRRLALLVTCLLGLTACRLDVDVAVTMQPDGTGSVVVTAIADAELIQQVPELVDDLRLDDATANGWVIDGPVATDSGGLTITLTHDFHSDADLANVLTSIGPPFTNMAAARTTADDQTVNAIDGDLVLPDGFESFADADLIQAVGGLPFGEQITASGLTPEQAMAVTFTVSLPGELITSTGTETDNGVFTWTAPLDGSSQDILTQTVQRPADTTNWAGPLSTISLIALIAWLVVATAFITFVAIARRRKRRRRERSLRNLAHVTDRV